MRAVGLADGLVRHRQLDPLRLERRDHLAPLEAGPGQDAQVGQAEPGSSGALVELAVPQRHQPVVDLPEARAVRHQLAMDEAAAGQIGRLEVPCSSSSRRSCRRTAMTCSPKRARVLAVRQLTYHDPRAAKHLQGCGPMMRVNDRAGGIDLPAGLAASAAMSTDDHGRMAAVPGSVNARRGVLSPRQFCTD